MIKIMFNIPNLVGQLDIRFQAQWQENSKDHDGKKIHEQMNF